MLTLLIVAVVLAALIGTVAMVGIGGLAVELGKVLFVCAAVLLLISMVIGIARGKMRA